MNTVYEQLHNSYLLSYKYLVWWMETEEKQNKKYQPQTKPPTSRTINKRDTGTSNEGNQTKIIYTRSK